MVWASEILGARPDFVASLITASTSDCHHSPTYISDRIHLLSNFSGKKEMTLKARLIGRKKTCKVWGRAYPIQQPLLCQVLGMGTEHHAWARWRRRHEQWPWARGYGHAIEECPFAQWWWSCKHTVARVELGTVLCMPAHRPNQSAIALSHAYDHQTSIKTAKFKNENIAIHIQSSRIRSIQHVVSIYQCMLRLYWTWLTTFTSTVSSSLAYRVGPGNRPLTVTMGLDAHSLVVFFNTTCIH